MSGTEIALVGFAGMLVMIACRVPIGFAMLLSGGVGYASLSNWSALFGYMKTNPYYQFSNYTLSVIPLFILMGAFAERAGIAAALFKSCESLLGRYRGGMAMAVIGACTAFGAICGSSVATTATFGRAALPELERYRYNSGFSTGTIAVGGTLGILIPPSVILVVYAITTEQNIAKLFQAALLPGLLAALSYIVTIFLVVRRNPSLAPVLEKTERPPASKVLWPKAIAVAIVAGVAIAALRGSIGLGGGLAGLFLALLVALVNVIVMPAILIAVVVVGGIYGGIFTPTEGASIGAITTMLVGLAQRRLDWQGIRASLLQTAETAGMIFIILLGAEVFGAFMALSELPATAAGFIAGSGLSPYVVLAIMLCFYVALGAVMDEMAMILLTLPIFFPIIQGLDFGMPADDVAIWFGVLVLVVVGIGLTAPPIGLNVFVISSLARHVPISATYRGVLPFLAADLTRLLLLIVFPAISLGLVHFLE